MSFSENKPDTVEIRQAENLMMDQDERSIAHHVSAAGDNVSKCPKKLSKRKSPVQKLKGSSSSRVAKERSREKEIETNIKDETPDTENVEDMETDSQQGLKAYSARFETGVKKSVAQQVSSARSETGVKKSVAAKSEEMSIETRSGLKVLKKTDAKSKSKASAAKAKKVLKKSNAKKTNAVAKRKSKVSPSKKAPVKKNAAKLVKKASVKKNAAKLVKKASVKKNTAKPAKKKPTVSAKSKAGRPVFKPKKK